VKLTEIKRKSIIDAAIEEFREYGFLGANITRIAKRADVSSRTLYKHFRNKEALFQAISKIMIERNSAMASANYDPDLPLDRQLVTALERYVDVITEPEAIGLNRMVIAELLRDLDRSRAFFAEFATHDYPITNLIAQAMDAGVLRKVDPEYATNQLLGLVKNFFFWPEFLLGDKRATPDIMKDCVAMFLGHYAVEG